MVGVVSTTDDDIYGELPASISVGCAHPANTTMTSKKTKKQRLNESRLKRARASIGVDPFDQNAQPPAGSVMADPKELAHNNTYGPLPRFYIDKIVVCRICGKEEVWPAERQKWWYEVAKGNINTDAVFCRECRDKERLRKAEARRVHFERLKEKKK